MKTIVQAMQLQIIFDMTKYGYPKILLYNVLKIGLPFKSAHQEKLRNIKMEDESKSSHTHVQLPNLNFKTSFSRFKKFWRCSTPLL